MGVMQNIPHIDTFTFFVNLLAGIDNDNKNDLQEDLESE